MLPREILWKCCNLLFGGGRGRGEYSLCLCKGSLAWLYSLCILIHSPGGRSSADNPSQQFPVLPDTTCPIAGTVWGHWPREPMAWRVMNGALCLVPSPTYIMLLSVCSSTFLSVLCSSCNADKKAVCLWSALNSLSLWKALNLWLFSHGREKLKVHLKAAGWQGVV